MGVFSRKNRTGVTYYAGYQVDGRQVQERVGPSRLAAERLLRQRQREVAGGVYQESAPTGALTLGAWLQRWLDARTCRSKRVSVWRAKRLLSRTWLTRRRVDELTPGDMARLVRELSTEVAPASVRGIWGTLSTCLRDAVIAGMIQANPCLLPRGLIPSPARTSREPYAPHEIQALLTDPRVEPHMRVVFALAFYGGVRRGEAVGFVWGDLQQARPLRALHLERQWDGGPLKTAKRAGEAARTIPVHPELERHLAEWAPVWEQIARRRPRPEDRILLNPAGRGLRWSPTSLEHRVDDACRAVDSRCLGLHSARHTAITWLRRCGARADVVEKITHNAKGSVVDRYTHWDWSPLCEAVLALSYGAGYGAAPESAEKPMPVATYEVCSVGVKLQQSSINLGCCASGEQSKTPGNCDVVATYGALHTCGPLGWGIRPQSARAARVRRVK